MLVLACPKCLTVRPDPRCAICGSECVDIAATIALSAQLMKQASLTKPKTVVRPDPSLELYGWLVSYDKFETFVAWREATTPAQAIAIATAPWQKWYMVVWVSGDMYKTKRITRAEWCDWASREETST